MIRYHRWLRWQRMQRAWILASANHVPHPDRGPDAHRPSAD